MDGKFESTFKLFVLDIMSQGHIFLSKDVLVELLLIGLDLSDDVKRTSFFVTSFVTGGFVSQVTKVYISLIQMFENQLARPNSVDTNFMEWKYGN